MDKTNLNLIEFDGNLILIRHFTIAQFEFNNSEDPRVKGVVTGLN